MMMRGRVRSVSGHQVEWLSAGWELGESDAGAVDGPASLAAAAIDWVPTVVPSTAASSLQRAGAWSFDGEARRFDARDWWYRARFPSEAAAHGEQLWLCFDGLATVADVWLNGAPLVSSESMFVAHERRVDGVLHSDNELVLRFRSLDALLAARRTRPRWRAPMVENQQLRWFRTTLLGRTPGWSPPAAPVGPWRGIRLERRRGVTIDQVRLNADGEGRLDIACRARNLDGSPFAGVALVLERDGRVFEAELAPVGRDDALAGRLIVPNVEPWWPHTHGEPALYAARLRTTHGGRVVDADLGAVGFRSVSLATGGNDFAILVNGVPLFCRGACWTPLDPVALANEPEALDRAFAQMREAGMNMVRVGGTMVYENDPFLDQCDTRGVLLWQDFMFANLDYPEDDPGFVQYVIEEAGQLLARLQGRPSLTVLCGNSEVEQQAAMWGALRERWHPPLFHERLAALARDACPGVPYWPSSAHGGAFPHQGNAGTTSYYGVGAYRRPIEDARRAEVRFATECLAFANIPEAPTPAPLARGSGLDVAPAAWRARTPRDLGADWDYDDVRDHYVASLFRVDPLALHAADPDRYVALGRVASGEVMAAVFAEWRRRRSVTRGGLIWFLRDLWPCAGWGVIDSAGAPKAAWYYLKRALAPVAMSFSDEGGNGLGLHLVNDRPAPMSGAIEIVLYRAGDVRVGRGLQSIDIGPHAALELNAAVFFDDSYDLSYAYRFGPPSHDVAVATFRDMAGAVLARAFHFVPGLPNLREPEVGVNGEARHRADGALDLSVRTRRLAQSVRIRLDGFISDDNYFHLAPGDERHLVLRRANGRPAVAAGVAPQGTLQALNAFELVPFSIAPAPPRP